MPRVDLRTYRKSKSPLKTLLRLFRYFDHCRMLFVTGIISIIVYVAATVAASYMMRPLVNVLEAGGIAPSRAYAEFIALLAGLYGLYILSAVTNYLLNRLMMGASIIIMKDLRDELFAKMQRLPVSYFDEHTHGSLMSYFTNDIEATNMLLRRSITQMLISLISLGGTVAMMLVLSVKLFTFMVILAAMVVIVMKKTTTISRNSYREQQSFAAKVNGYIEEMIAGQKDIKVFTHEKETVENFEDINEGYRRASTRATIATSIVMPILNNISHIFYALCCLFGVLLLTGEYVGGILITFLQYIRTFSERVSQISEQFNSIMHALAGSERIFAVLDLDDEVNTGDIRLVKQDDRFFWQTKSGQELVELRGDIKFSKVDFAYIPQKPVLQDLSLRAKPGETIAFVGSTGAGKTTITNLLNRFYEINGGTIKYDGIDIRDLDKFDLRRTLGIVLQDTCLFTGTVMENIRYGRLDASDQECVEAAKIANAHYFISHLPKGYATEIYANGANLSQGQRQLIAIARAAVTKAPVLILDEATSSVDTRTEKLIEKGLVALMQNKTVFIIAHRLSTVRHSDHILVLEHGKVIEQGDHASLLALRGEYYKLYMNMIELA